MDLSCLIQNKWMDGWIISTVTNITASLNFCQMLFAFIPTVTHNFDTKLSNFHDFLTVHPQHTVSL